MKKQTLTLLTVAVFLTIAVLPKGCIAHAQLAQEIQMEIKKTGEPTEPGDSLVLKLAKDVSIGIAQGIIKVLEQVRDIALPGFPVEYRNVITLIINETISYYQNYIPRVEKAETVQELQTINQESKSFFEQKSDELFIEVGRLIQADVNELIKTGRDYSTKAWDVVGGLKALGHDTSEVEELLVEFDQLVDVTETKGTEAVQKITAPQQRGDRMAGFQLLKQVTENVESAGNLMELIEQKVMEMIGG